VHWVAVTLHWVVSRVKVESVPLICTLYPVIVRPPVVGAVQEKRTPRPSMTVVGAAI
jgi:hypothetical protein